MKYVIATSKPTLVDIVSITADIVFLDNTFEHYTTDINMMATFDTYEAAHEETKVDVKNHDFVISFEIAKKILEKVQ